MRDERRNYVIVGAFVLGMLGAFGIVIALLTGRGGASDPYHVVYDEVMGLSTGTQVLYAGFPVGAVEEISPVLQDGRPRFRVDLRLKRGWRIPEDSVAQITASGLLSAVVVNIESGRSTAFLEPGAEIRGAETTNLFSVVASVAGEIQGLTEQMRPLLASLASNAPELIENLEAATRDLREAVARVNELVGPANSERLATILANAESATANFDAVSADLRATQGRFDRIGTRIESMIERSEADVEHAVVDLHDSLESVSSHIEAINRNVETMTRNLSEFSLQLRRNPSVLIRGRSSEGTDAR